MTKNERDQMERAVARALGDWEPFGLSVELTKKDGEIVRGQFSDRVAGALGTGAVRMDALIKAARSGR